MGDGQLREMPHILRQMPWHAAFESNGTVVTFLVTGLRPNQIHREGFGEIVAPILLVFTPGKSGLGFVIATAATIVLHFTHSLKSELGSVVYRLAQTRQTAATTSDRHRCLDGRMMLVIHDSKSL